MSSGALSLDPAGPRDPSPFHEAAGPAPPLPSRGAAPTWTARGVGALRRFFARHRVLRILGKATLALLALLLVARLALPLVLPAILRGVARGAGLSIAYEKLSLSLLGGQVECHHLVVAPLEGGPAIARVPYLRAVIAPASLLSGRPRLRRLEVDGLFADIEREADGELAIVKRIRSARGAPSEESEPADGASPSAGPGLADPPVAVDELLLSNATLRFRDASVSPALDERVQLDVRLVDLGTDAARPATLHVRLGMAPVLERLELSVTGHVGPAGGAGDLSLTLDRLDPGALRGYLTPLGLTPIAREINFQLAGRVDASPSADAAGGLDGALRVEGIRATADGDPFLALDRVWVAFEGLGASGGVVPRVEVEGGRALARRRAGGGIAVAGLEIGPVPAPARLAEMSADAVADAPAAMAANAPAASISRRSPFRLEVGVVSVRDVEARFQDEVPSPAADVAILLESLALTGILIDPERPDARIEIDARLRAPGIVDSVVITGGAGPFGTRRGLDLALRAEGISLTALAPYLRAAGVESRLADGRIGLALTAHAASGAGGDLAADLEVRDITLSDGPVERFGVDRITVAGASLAPRRGRYEVGVIEVVRPRLQARRLADGSLEGLGMHLFALREGGAQETRDGLGTDEALEERASDRAASGDGSSAPSFPTATATATATASSEARPTGRTSPTAPFPSLHVGWIAIVDADLAFDDAALATPTALALRGATIEVEGVEASLDPAAPAPEPALLRAWASLPAVAERVEVVGRFVPSPLRPSLRLEVAATGIAPDALQGYLARHGLRSELRSGRLDLALEARAELPQGGPIVVGATLERLDLVDGERELLSVEGAELGPVTILFRHRALARVDIAEVALQSLRASAAIGADGALRVLGMRYAAPERAPAPPTPVAALEGSLESAAAELADDAVKGAKDAALGILRDAGAPVTATADAPPGTVTRDDEPPPAWLPRSTPPVSLPLVRLESGLTIGEVRLDLRDESRSPALEQRASLGARLGPCTLDLSGRTAPEGAPLHVEVRAPGTLSSLQASATLTAAPGGVSVTARVTGRGITLRGLRGLLAESGLDPALQDGSLALSLDAEAGATAAGGLRASVAIRDLALMDGARELAGIDALVVSGVAITAGEVVVEDIEVVRARAGVWRDAEGGVTTCGIRATPTAVAAPTLPAPTGVTTTAQSATRTSDAATAVTIAARAATGFFAAALTPTATSPLPTIDVKRARIVHAAVRFFDAAADPATETSLQVDAGVDRFEMRQGARSFAFEARARVPGALHALTITGTATADPEAPRLALRLDARGVRAGPLAPYLPSGIALPVRDGRLSLRFEAEARRAEEGGTAARVLVTHLDWRDGRDAPPLLRLDGALLTAPRIDLAAGRIDLDEVSITGIETNAEWTAAGAISTLGLVFGASAAVPVPVTGGADAATKAGVAAARISSLVAGVPLAGAALARHPRLPLILVKDLRLGVRSARFLDGSRPGAVPVALEALELRNFATIRLLGHDPWSNPPIELGLTGRVSPGVRALEVRVRAAPFAVHPDLELRIAASGIDGPALAELSPWLGAALDGRGLTDGRLGVTLTASLDLGRRAGPLEFDLTRGFGGDLTVRGLSLRNGREGPILLGLTELHVDVAKVDPASGDVHIRAVEVARPVGEAYRASDGLHVGGLVLLSPKGAASAGPEARTRAARAARAATPPTDPELRIDRISLSEVAFTYSDRVADPPLIVPLVGLDVEIMGFTTRAFTQRRPVRFDALFRGGEVSLPKHIEKAAIPGLGPLSRLDDLSAMVGLTRAKKPVREEREAFDEVVVKGELTFAPRLFGSVRASASGVELANLTGLARAAGVSLGNGVLDTSVNATFEADGGLAIESYTTITDLDLSEPPGGPLSRFLNLPVPLDAVIFALRDEDGEIGIPLRIRVKPPGVSTSQILSVASATFLQLVADALAAAPLRVLESFATLGRDVVAAIIPGAGDPDEPSKDEPMTVTFAASDPALPAAAEAAIASATALAWDDEEVVISLTHELGSLDLARASIIANPGVVDRRDAIERLKARRASVRRERADAVAEARAARMLGTEQRLRSLAGDVARLDDELARLSRALDALYALERGGAERQAYRRTREVAVSLGEARLEAVKQALIARGLPSGPEVRVTRPRGGGTAREGTGAVVIRIARRELLR